MITRYIIILTVLLALLAPGASVRAQGNRKALHRSKQSGQAELDARLAKSKADILKATRDYKASLENLLVFYEDDVNKSAEVVEKRQKLYAEGIVSKRELEESEQKLANAKAKLEGLHKQISDADDMIAEAEAAEYEAKYPRMPSESYSVKDGLIRYNGSSKWSLKDTAKVENFFSKKFGRPLPISAYGQTTVHDRLGFDHHNAIDVAVNPASTEGQALMAYLRNAGIPFLAFNYAILGSATGTHIHIGKPSVRIAAQPASF